MEGIWLLSQASGYTLEVGDLTNVSKIMYMRIAK